LDRSHCYRPPAPPVRWPKNARCCLKSYPGLNWFIYNAWNTKPVKVFHFASFNSSYTPALSEYTTVTVCLSVYLSYYLSLVWICVGCVGISTQETAKNVPAWRRTPFLRLSEHSKQLEVRTPHRRLKCIEYCNKVRITKCHRCNVIILIIKITYH